MNGVAITTSSDGVKFAHTSSGMRQNVIPGARIVMIVTRKLRAVMIEDAPAHWTPWLKKIAPIGWWWGLRGGWPAQPPARAPTMTELSISRRAMGSSQNESAFRRGKAMSAAPSISGTTKFARPAKAGIRKRKIINEAWTRSEERRVGKE